MKRWRATAVFILLLLAACAPPAGEPSAQEVTATLPPPPPTTTPAPSPVSTVGPDSPAPLTPPAVSPRPTRTPLGQTGVVPDTLQVLPPVLVDGEHGRLYTNAVVDGITHTVSLDAVTGKLDTVYGLTGALALDTARNRLFVDKNTFGLTVIDTETGGVPNVMPLPSGEWSRARPQADPVTGNVLLFRDSTVFTADPLAKSWFRTTPISVTGTVCDEPMMPPPTIHQTWLDPDGRLLYLSFLDYVCTPWFNFTVVVLNLDSMEEIARFSELHPSSGAAIDGRFYGKSWFRLGTTFKWAWQNGQWWLEPVEHGIDQTQAYSGFFIDPARRLLIEQTSIGVQALDMETMAVVSEIQSPVDGQLAAFDPVSDNFYFLGKDGRLHPWPASNMTGN